MGGRVGRRRTAPNAGSTPPCDDVPPSERGFDALIEVIAALEPLTMEQRRRVVTAAAVLLGDVPSSIKVN